MRRTVIEVVAGYVVELVADGAQKLDEYRRTNSVHLEEVEVVEHFDQIWKKLLLEHNQ